MNDKIMIPNLRLLLLKDGNDEFSYGANQEWFRTPWQRKSGCGPSTATNIFYYMKRKARPGDAAWDFERFRLFMEEIWTFVTPTRHGLPEAGLLATRIKNYINTRHVAAVCKPTEICADAAQRPVIGEAVDCISKSLAADCPVAFLNLEYEGEPNLDKWHWVTIIGIEILDGGIAEVTFIDNGKIKTFNLTHWWNESNGAGGYVTVIPANI